MKITESGLIVPQKDEIKLNMRELTMRLGMEKDADISFAEKNMAEVIKTADCKGCFIRCEISVTQEECDFGFAAVKSKPLCKNLEGCKSAFVFAATLGADIDRLIARKAAISAAQQFITDAAASSYMEALADCVNDRLKKNLVCRPRFSPGFGGFELELQKKIIEILNASKLIGITLTESKMMVPTKSVTAVIGIRGEVQSENN